MNEADQQFVKNKVNAELQVSDITKAVKANVPVKPKGKKMQSLKEFLSANDPTDLAKQARTLCYIENSITPTLYEGFLQEESRARARRAGGSFSNVGKQDRAADIVSAAEKLDKQQLLLADAELRLRDARKEQEVLRLEKNSLDPKTAALAKQALQTLEERILPDALRAAEAARESVTNAQIYLRALRNPGVKETDTGPTGRVVGG